MTNVPSTIVFCKSKHGARLLIVFLVFFADIRRSTRPFLEDKTEDDFFQIDVSPSISFHCLILLQRDRYTFDLLNSLTILN